jgi:hypothetical protein
MFHCQRLVIGFKLDAAASSISPYAFSSAVCSLRRPTFHSHQTSKTLSAWHTMRQLLSGRQHIVKRH